MLSIEQTIKDILKTNLNVEDNELNISADVYFTIDLQFTPYELETLFDQVEKEFELRIPQVEREELHTVKELVEYVTLATE